MSSLDNDQKKATVVKDFFAQCERCKYWLRLRPLDEAGYRTIPLRNCVRREDFGIDIKGEYWTERECWVCQRCYDMSVGVG